MPHPSLPKEVREFLLRTNSVSLRALLLSPCKAEGTVIFAPSDERLRVRGDFFPHETKVVISAAVPGQLILGKSGILLNVTLTPGRLEKSDIEHFQFELVEWKPLVETNVG